MINAAIIGMGGISGAHLPFYLKNKDKVKFYAGCDIIEERATGKDKVDINIQYCGEDAALDHLVYTDYLELLKNPQIHAVDICTPTYLHAEIAISALKAGKDVICEKPMALSIENAEAMIKAATESGRKLMIAQCIRFSPQYEYIIELKKNKKYGNLLSANFVRNSALPSWGENSWYSNLELSGGAILDLHIHDTDFIRYGFGMPKTVYTMGNEYNGDINYVVTHYNYGEGEPLITAEGGWGQCPCDFPFRMDFTAYFEEAIIDYKDYILTVYPKNEKKIVPTFSDKSIYELELEYFYDAIANNTTIEKSSALTTLDTIKLINAEKESFHSKQSVKL